MILLDSHRDAREGANGAPVFNLRPAQATPPQPAVAQGDPHQVRVVTADAEGCPGEADYFAVCRCGWNSGPLVFRVDAEASRCQVALAERERAWRQSVFGARLQGAR